MSLTVDSECAFRELLLGIHKECIVDDVLFNVAFHVAGRLFLFILVNECLDHVEGGRVVFPPLGLLLNCIGALLIRLNVKIAAVVLWLNRIAMGDLRSWSASSTHFLSWIDWIFCLVLTIRR